MLRLPNLGLFLLLAACGGTSDSPREATAERIASTKAGQPQQSSQPAVASDSAGAMEGADGPIDPTPDNAELNPKVIPDFSEPEAAAAETGKSSRAPAEATPAPALAEEGPAAEAEAEPAAEEFSTADATPR